LQRITFCDAELNSSTTDERIATQECSTGVTEAGILKNILLKMKIPGNGWNDWK
jgi:hypothetical protein